MDSYSPVVNCLFALVFDDVYFCMVVWIFYLLLYFDILFIHQYYTSGESNMIGKKRPRVPASNVTRTFIRIMYKKSFPVKNKKRKFRPNLSGFMDG